MLYICGWMDGLDGIGWDWMGLDGMVIICRRKSNNKFVLVS